MHIGAYKRIERALNAERRALAKLGGEEESGQNIVRGMSAWAQAAVAAGIAQRVSSDVRHVALHPDLPIPVDPISASRMTANALMKPFVELAVADDFARRLDGATQRLGDLLSLMHQALLSDTASDYLTRAGALYLWGFEKESYAVARSTLDAALADRLARDWPEDEQKRRLNKAPRSRLALKDRIDLAGTHHFRLLEPAKVKLAHGIRLDGNDILHAGAAVPLNFSTTMQMLGALREVLLALFPAPTP